MFAQEEATHVFYVERFMTNVARYVKWALLLRILLYTDRNQMTSVPSSSC